MDVLEPPDRHRGVPTITAAVLAIAYLILQPPGADLPAQLYRAHLFSANGFSLWDNFWYAGHNLLGYSVLYPPLAALLTPRVLGALAAVAAAAAFEVMARRQFGQQAWLGSAWLAVGTASELVSGRLTFMLGLAGLAGTALLLQCHFREPRARTLSIAAGLALLTALASPVAAVFAALVGAAPAIAHRRDLRAIWAGAVIVVAALVPVIALNLVFGEGGRQPDAVSTVWPLVVIAVALVATMTMMPRHRVEYRPGLGPQPTLTVAVVLYLAGCLAAFALDTPIGANANRLGELTAGPLVALLLYPLRRNRRAFAALLLVAAPLAYIQVKDAVTDVARGASGGAQSESYYQPLLSYLGTRPGAGAKLFRVEIPMTRGHWESYYVASEFPLARGWERQDDIRDNPLFYDDGGASGVGIVNATSYRRWLHRNAVRYVAVAAAPPDYSSRAEVALIDAGLPYLRLIRRLPNWRVYAVVDPTPIVTGVARLTGQLQDELALAVRRSGAVVVRVRFSPFWRLSGLSGCVAPDGQFTKLSVRGHGSALLEISFAPSRIRATTPRCS